MSEHADLIATVREALTFASRADFGTHNDYERIASALAALDRLAALVCLTIEEAEEALRVMRASHHGPNPNPLYVTNCEVCALIESLAARLSEAKA